MASRKSDFHWVKDAKGKRHYVMKGADPELFLEKRPNCKDEYKTSTREKVIELYMRGYSIREIGEMLHFHNYKTIFSWRRKYPDFDRELKSARALRAEYFEEEALSVASKAEEDNVQSSRLKCDVLKWAAEVNNPEVYGKRTKIVGDPNAPIGFIVDTGIRRDSLPPPEEEKA